MSTPDPQQDPSPKKSIIAILTSLFLLCSAVLGVVQHKIVIGFMKKSVNWIETTVEGKDAIAKEPDASSKNTKLDLTTFGTNRVYYNFEKIIILLDLDLYSLILQKLSLEIFSLK